MYLSDSQSIIYKINLEFYREKVDIYILYIHFR